MFTAYLVDDEELIKAVKDSNTACEFVMISAFDYFDSVRAFFQRLCEKNSVNAEL